MFSFLRSLKSGCTSLHSHQQCKRVPFPPISSPTPLGGGVFDDGYYNRVKWNLNLVLICISFMDRDGENFSCVFGHLNFFFGKRFV
jgi:hypothetical protein